MAELTAPEPHHALDEHSRAQFDARDPAPPGKDEEQASGLIADLAPEARSRFSHLHTQCFHGPGRADAIPPARLIDRRRPWSGPIRLAAVPSRSRAHAHVTRPAVDATKGRMHRCHGQQLCQKSCRETSSVVHTSTRWPLCIGSQLAMDSTTSSSGSTSSLAASMRATSLRRIVVARIAAPLSIRNAPTRKATWKPETKALTLSAGVGA